MDDEQWNEITARVAAHDAGKDINGVLKTMIKIGEAPENRAASVASMKALCRTLENSPFGTRKADPPQVVEALEALRLALTIMWNENDDLFTIVEVPHGKTGMTHFESGEEWVQKKLKVYRQRLLAAAKNGGL